MTAPLVSVCVPTCDRVDFLRESLLSITAQTYEPLEILISDNASTDATEAVCRELAARDPRVRYIRHARNIGLYQNHNLCIDESRGEYLGFLHDDDLHSPSLIAENAAVLTAHPSVGIVCADWDLIDDAGACFATRRFAVGTVTPGLDYIERTLATGRSSICCPGTLIRRSALGEIRFPETGPIGFGDFLLWFEIAERADVGHVGKPLWSYRQHARSLSRRTIESLTEDYIVNLEAYFVGHLRRWPGETRRITRWRRLAARYAFWALIYEICLHARRERGVSTPGSSPTIFEQANYHLSAAEVVRVRATLRRLRHGVVEDFVLFVMERLLDAGLTAPLAWATRHTERVRALLVAR